MHFEIVAPKQGTDILVAKTPKDNGHKLTEMLRGDFVVRNFQQSIMSGNASIPNMDVC
jgi:hypothetical protein